MTYIVIEGVIGVGKTALTRVPFSRELCLSAG
jgi:deoxyadenosine/deoxycytidine kinase